MSALNNGDLQGIKSLTLTRKKIVIKYKSFFRLPKSLVFQTNAEAIQMFKSLAKWLSIN